MLHVREYCDADEELLLSMMEKFCREGGFPWEPELRKENLRYFSSHPHCGQAWMMEFSEEPCGYAVVTFGFSFEFGGKDAFVDEIYLQPHVRRRGLGKATLDRVGRIIHALGIKQLHLEADIEDEILKPFYESCGYLQRSYRLFSKRLG